ncbi:MAG: bifunctional diaminohydroxyphosphoribosylaminopyrimidine deaminase/5-amino-6-(5-phosphoribosylamino)uracil reductase RibD [Lachnospiraceae bacterium]|nr:bifunctional diaminohydroxyphosphoribosylaminopyrimidine deaminase/5-amino-6-(5-phosphoribosylamino)uracil reductase RibD [Lachnospiraceae bacterium]
MNYEDYMRRAIELAQKGEGHTNPNPLVGAVIVKNGKIIGEGYHEKYGGLHAERNALKHCCESPEGATMYVTLEPCCHHGKQPPCTEAILEAKIAKVIIGSKDPNPLVAGKGVKQLRDAGIEVEEDFLKADCDAINDIFFHYIGEKRPLVALKYAMTADGKIAASDGQSQWITGEKARAHVHRLRNRYAAILVGMGTVEKDDPMLTCRGVENPSHPLRIVLDTRGRIPEDCKLVKSARNRENIPEAESAGIPLWVATCDMEPSKEERLVGKGVTVVRLPKKNGKVSLPALMEKLYEAEIDSLLVEGGAEVNGSFLAEGLVDKVYAYIGGKLLGGGGKSPIGGEGLPLPDAVMLRPVEVTNWDEDILITYRVSRSPSAAYPGSMASGDVGT